MKKLYLCIMVIGNDLPMVLTYDWEDTQRMDSDLISIEAAIDDKVAVMLIPPNQGRENLKTTRYMLNGEHIRYVYCQEDV